ncbi:hypothetical protein KQX54_013790 [Cotesia glomerata]|uniref:non-specific serine/threonine protein kinase n=1 Tax=Cotesia glomerata TaxID=32391 RepID=A0AAV7J7J1_COTGL|nr:hypothetical protein KQX54_013790 [Cotesia glomerata]
MEKVDKAAVHLSMSNNKLSLTTVRAYFPHVSGLTYFKKENVKCGLTLNNDEFELIPGVTEYEVYSFVYIPSEHNQNDLKRKRIHQIMDIFERKRDENLTDQDIHENKLANSNGEIFDRFTAPIGKKFTFWEFCHSKLKCRNSQLRLLLLTTTQEKHASIKSGDIVKSVPQKLTTIQENHAFVKSKDSVKFVSQEKATTSTQLNFNHKSLSKVPVAGSRLRFSVSNKKGSSSITLVNHISIDKKDNDVGSIRISYLHELNPVVLHKDLKPDNIVINKNFEVKICDLGLSKICDIMPPLNTTVGQNFHGTTIYMAPEILIDNEPRTVHSDVWSMACCITELFSEKSV